jgi:outer membrane protein
MDKNKILARCALAALAAVACGAHAQTAGTWLFSLGATRIAPNTSSGNLSPPSAPGTTIDVGADTEATLSVGRMITDHWSWELPIGFGYKHKVFGSGAISGVGQIGTVKALPITLFAQYRFLEPTARFRPYAMLGLTYAHFYGERGSATLNGINPVNPPGGTGLSVASRFGVTPGLGLTVAINQRWYVDLQYAHSFLKTTATLSTGQKIDTRLDPDAYRIAVGVRF